jgi:hypothetical protein
MNEKPEIAKDNLSPIKKKSIIFWRPDQYQ